MSDTPTKSAADVMTKKPVVIQSSTTIKEVADWFLENDFSCAPVLGSTGEVLGIMDEFSLIRVNLVRHFQEEGKDKVAHHVELLNPPYFISESAPITDVVKEMIKAPNHRLLVLNKSKKLVGIISPKDIIRIMAGERQKSVNLKVELERTRRDLDEMSKELENTKTRLEIYKDIVVDNPNMIHSVDASGRILMANKKIHQILGYDYGELVGRRIEDIYSKSVHHEAYAGLKKIMEKGFHQNTFTTMVTKSGVKIRADIASSAILDDAGNFVGTISVSRPVDADILLRALHGVLTKDVLDGARYGLLDDLEKEVIEKKTSTG